MTPTERVKKGLSALPDSYRGAQPGGLGTMRMQKYMPTRGEIRDINQKYQRGADIQKFVDRNILADRAKAAGATSSVGPDGIERLNLAGTGIKDPVTGATMLSMQAPSLTATAPTFGQLLGDMGRGLGSIAKGFAEKGSPMIQLGKGLLDMFTPKKATVNTGGGSSITTTETTPSLDLEAKMSAYTDPIMYYANRQKSDASQVGEGVKYLDDVKSTMVADAGNATQKYMNLLQNIQNLGKTRYGNFGVQDILSSPTLTYEKEIGPGTFSTKIGDNKVQAGYSMIFNKGGRVQGTGIMGAL